jgi:WD40 repeat protein
MLLTKGFRTQGFAVAPQNSHVFAAGADRRVRCWDVRSGSQVTSADAYGTLWTGSTNPLCKIFDTPVTGLEIPQPGVLNLLHDSQLEVYSCGRLDAWEPVPLM